MQTTLFHPDSRIFKWLVEYKYPLLILLAIPALYAYNPLPLYFLNDDFIHVPLSQQAVWGQRNSIRPVGDFSLYLDYLVWGNRATGYHLTNLLLHLFDSILVYHLCRLLFVRLNLQGNVKWWSACAALLFWGYAFHSESVLWIIGRTGCLSSFFFLICLLIFLSNNRRWHFVLLSYASFSLGLLTYESVVILPPALVLLAIVFKDLRSKKNLLFISGYWALFILYLVLRIQWTGELAGSYEGENIVHLKIPLLAGNYCKLMLRSIVAPQADTKFFLVSGAAFVAMLITFAVVQLKRFSLTKPMLLMLAIYLLSYLPYISLGIDTHGVEAERYLYLPSIFICILAAVFFSMWKSKQTAVIVFALLFIYHQHYLLKSSNAFAIASDIAKKTIEIIKNNPNANALYFKNLPQNNYGVTIFRLGLEEGVNWQTGNANASQKVRIISFNEERNYDVVNKPTIRYADTSTFMIPQVLKRNMDAGKVPFDTLKNEVFHPQTDLLIDYTGTEIKVFKPR